MPCAFHHKNLVESMKHGAGSMMACDCFAESVIAGLIDGYRLLGFCCTTWSNIVICNIPLNK